MEETTTCPDCHGQAWEIYRDRVSCLKCGREFLLLDMLILNHVNAQRGKADRKRDDQQSE